ncbi:hypothetical protein ACJX0J_024192, partial [Zea mays]
DSGGRLQKHVLLKRDNGDVDLSKQVDAQPVNVKDVDRMRREMQAIEDDIANTEKGKAALEDKFWEVEAKLVTKLEELERHAHQCNQALKKLKPTVAFQSSCKEMRSTTLHFIAYRLCCAVVGFF